MQNKELKYERLYKQISELLTNVDNRTSKLATIIAILHNKNKDFFWTGFYFLTKENNLEVACYQGPLACIRLKKNTGVCWEGIKLKQAVIVGNVHEFVGHIACSSQTNSEIVVPIFEKENVIGVLDIDSKKFNCFDEIDAKWLKNILALI